jgi:hypothetical protein
LGGIGGGLPGYADVLLELWAKNKRDSFEM